ncbi:MAG: glycosyltransferase [Pseudomonadota bacterium]
MKLAILSTHLSGTGHFLRSLSLARAAARAGHRALVINGGRPLPHIASGDVEMLQIPPLLVEGLDYKTLRTADGAPAGAAYLARRQRAVAEAVSGFVPDLLVTETFPLGRRMLAAEFDAALSATAAPAIASLRDIPEPKPKRLDEAVARLRARYAGLIVHGDAGVVPLTESWPLPEDLLQRTRYSGYLSSARAEVAERGQTVLVAVGGGDLGRRLLEMAAEAAESSDRPWHLLVGGRDAAQEAARLATAHPSERLRVEPARPDYRALLAGAACSVSLAGYNTVLDLAETQTPALLVPSETGGEQEQRIRAERVAMFEGIRWCSEADLAPARLGQMVETLAQAPRRPRLPLRIDDGSAAIAALTDLAREPA